MIEPWRVLASQITFRDRWLTVRTDRCLTPAGVEVSPYHVLEYPDWVNVVGLTKDSGRLVMVREYRHGRGEILLGLVSGAIEPVDGGDAATSFEAAARRELREETGYVAGRVLAVLESFSNAGSHNNRVTSVLAFDLELAGAPSPDPGETIEVVLDELDAVLRRVLSGETVMQAMHVAALWAAATRIGADQSLPETLRPLRARLRALFAGA